MKGRILQSKWIVYGIALGLILLIHSEAIPGNDRFSPEEDKGPVVRVKKPGPKISLAQQERFETLMTEGKRLLKNWMDYNGAIQKFQEAMPLASQINQKSDVYYYLSLAYFHILEEEGEAPFVRMVEKLIEIDYYRELDKNECSPKYLERFQEIRGRYGLVNILSIPSGADVYINKSKIPAGITPFTYIAKAGQIEIQVQKDSKKKKDKVTVKAGEEITTPAYELTGSSKKFYIIAGGAAAGLIVGGIAIFGGGNGNGNGTNGATTGSIDIKSEPSGAAIHVDNVDKGLTTPSVLTGITPGSHTVKLVLENYADYIETIDVAAGQTSNVDASLTAHVITVTAPKSTQEFMRDKNLKISIKWEVDATSSGQNSISAIPLAKAITDMENGSLSLIRRKALWLRSISPDLSMRANNFESINAVRSHDRAVARSGRAWNPRSAASQSVQNLPANPGRIRDLYSSSQRFLNINTYSPGNQTKFSPGTLNTASTMFLNKVKISRVNGDVIEEEVDATTGVYLWKVGDTLAAGTYKVSVESTTDRNIYDESEEFKIFEPDFEYKLQFTIPLVNMDDPHGLAVDRNFLYVTTTGEQTGQQMIYKLNKGTGNVVSSKNISPARPFQIAIDKQGFLYIAEEGNNRVAKYNSNLVRQSVTWKAPPNESGRINPRGVTVDGAGNVYVLDYGLVFRVLKYRPDGTFIKVIDNRFNKPLSLAVDRQRKVLYVADRLNNQVVRYDTNGNYQGVWIDMFEEESHPSGIAVSSKGFVFVSTQNVDKQKVFKIGPNGNVKNQFGSPGFLPDQFYHPVSVAVDKYDDDSVYILDSHPGTMRITKWRAVRKTN